MKNKQNWIAAAIVLLFALGLVYTRWEPSAADSPEEYQRIVLGGFSPDGTKLLLNFCKMNGVCGHGYFDFQKQRFVSIDPADKSQAWNVGSFSNDGKKIAVSVRRQSEDGRYGQIAILDTETGSIVELTKTRSQKMAPSFSHDGKKIIFIQSSKERESGMTRFSGMNIYEIELATGKENRLTGYSFFSAINPAYLPDDKRFMFAGEGPSDLLAPGIEAFLSVYFTRWQEDCLCRTG